MQLQQAVNRTFVQLAATVRQLSPSQYTQPCRNLNNHTIGQHVRHIIEFFECLHNGYDNGIVNYENRKRDVRLETSKDLALKMLQNIFKHLNKADKTMELQTSYDEPAEQTMVITTNYHREIVYNLEHTIHHMALIRVGIKEVSNITLPENFGVASSTVRHHKQCAQ